MWIFFIFIHIGFYSNPHIMFVVSQGFEAASPKTVHTIHIIHNKPKIQYSQGFEGGRDLLFRTSMLQYTYLINAGVSLSDF